MRKKRPIHTRISAIIMIGDALCLLIFGRYWAWDFKYFTWEMQRELRKKGGKT